MSIARRIKSVAGADATRAAVPAFLATIAIEYLAFRRRKTVEIADPTEASNYDAPLGYEPRDTAASLAMGVGSLVINGFASAALDPLDRSLYRRRLMHVAPKRGAWLLAIVAWDFLYYWDHRWSHEHRVLWAAHVNHHSSERYNLSTALRQSWTGFVVHWVFMPMFALGFSPSQVARAGEINLLYQYWVHTEAVDRLPPRAEQILNTASHHRVHHGADSQYLDRNYAGIFIIWDRLFGTFEPEGQRVTYGLTKNIDTFNPIDIAFHEWRAILRDVRSARSLRDRVGYVLGPPGWTPEQSEGSLDRDRVGG